MKLLLDTHIWLWSHGETSRIVPRIAEALSSTENELWLSPITLWELGLLVAKKRLRLEPNLEEWVATAMRAVPVKEAALTWEVALEAGRLLLPHRDPADRFLAATTRVFGLTLVTADRQLIGREGIPALANI